MVMLKKKKKKKKICAYIFCLYTKMLLPLFQNDIEYILYLWHAKLVNHAISAESFTQIFCLKYLINKELHAIHGYQLVLSTTNE